VKWAVAVQERLMAAEWPEKLLSHPAAAEEWAGNDDQVIFRYLFQFLLSKLMLSKRFACAYGTSFVFSSSSTRSIDSSH
jgi:hypothetical protein